MPDDEEERNISPQEEIGRTQTVFLLQGIIELIPFFQRGAGKLFDYLFRFILLFGVVVGFFAVSISFVVLTVLTDKQRIAGKFFNLFIGQIALGRVKKELLFLNKKYY